MNGRVNYSYRVPVPFRAHVNKYNTGEYARRGGARKSNHPFVPDSSRTFNILLRPVHEIVNRAEVIKRSCNSEFLIIVLSSQNSRRWNSESNLKKKEKKSVDDDAHIVVEVFNLDRDAAHLRQTRG